MNAATIIEVCKAWDEAFVTNNVELISPFMTDDWVIVGADGISSKVDFLAGISTGKLTHSRMDSDEQHVKIHGDAAIVISRGTSAGSWEGKHFSLYEWSTSVFIKQKEKWVCVSTMLTPAKLTGNSG